MRPNISIRRGGATDAAAVADVFLASRASMTYLPQLHTEADTRAFIARVVRDLEVWVAESGGQIVGFAALRDDWLDHLYVRPSFFNGRIGTRLLQYVKVLRPQGFQFWVFQQNTGARRFYERYDCVAVEFTDGSGNEEKLPDVRYEWSGE